MHQFYAPDILVNKQLPEEESQHCVRVLRLEAGTQIEVIDGNGTRYTCEITLAHAKKCQVEIINKEIIPNHWGAELIIGIAPTKNIDRIEWMAEKVTETGVNRIIPLRCRYSERKEIKTARINKILVSAMKQSLKATLPVLDELTPIKDVILLPFKGQKFIAYCDKTIERRSFVNEYSKGENALILIGPEGDFSPEEVDLAMSNGFIPVTLGESRFRTETAAVFACAAFHVKNQL